MDTLPDYLKNLFPVISSIYDNQVNNAQNIMNNAGQNAEQYESWRANTDSGLLDLYDTYTKWANSPDQAGKHDDQIKALYDLISKGDYNDIAQWFSSNNRLDGFNTLDSLLGSGFEKWLDNKTSQQNTQDARSWEEYMRDTSLTSTASQLQSLGLSNSGVLQTLATHNGVAAADNVKTNFSAQRQLARYNQKMAIAKQLLGMTSQMASAGIYGGAIGAARKASSVLTSGAAHSALAVQNQLNDYKYAELQKMPGWKEYY